MKYNHIHTLVQPSPSFISRAVFNFPDWNSVLIKNHFPLPHTLVPSPWQPPFYSSSLNFPTLGTSCKWNHAPVILSCLAYFTYNVFRLHSCCSTWQDFLLLCGRNKILLFVGTPCFFHFIYLSMDIWTVPTFWLLPATILLSWNEAKAWRKTQWKEFGELELSYWIQLILKPSYLWMSQICGTMDFFIGEVSLGFLMAISHLTDVSPKTLSGFTTVEENENEQNHRKVGNILLTRMPGKNFKHVLKKIL